MLENEFGELSIDDKLLAQKLSGAEQIVVADNGCICCTVRGDLVNMIGQVLDRNDTLPPEKQIEAIMIETTGMADPSPVLQTFVASERCVLFVLFCFVCLPLCLSEQCICSLLHG